MPFLYFTANSGFMPELLSFQTKESSDEELFEILHPIIRSWFKNKFSSFSAPQKLSLMKIQSRENVLVSAPTGSGKTLSAFLTVLNSLIDSSEKGILENRIYCVYISPLKALNRDIEVNLVEPLKEMETLANKKLGIRVAVRTGDTTSYEKSKMLATPPHILITTPESLAIILSSEKFRNHLTKVEWVIVDEIHSLAENKRGVHLSISLERLQYLSGHICRVGLSATVAPLDNIARFLVGASRSCSIVDVQFLKSLDVQVISPLPNLIDADHMILNTAMYQIIDRLIQEHKTTLIFTNTRAATERVVDHLKTKYPSRYEGLIGAHHGSLSKETRQRIEQQLRDGKLKCVVSSTSLELGIDIGSIDLVICLGSPKSVARFLQRAGRAGHRLHSTIKARLIVMDRDDLVECSVLLKSALEKNIDKVHIPSGALDVLAQQIVGISFERVWEEGELFDMLKKSYCFRDLKRKDFSAVLSFLAGEFVELEERNVYARIWRKDGSIGPRGKLGRVIYMTNIGTIPSESFILVKVGTETIGKLDEAFLERLKTGDVFVLGGETYEFRFARGMVAQVIATSNRPPTVPSWVSEMLPLSFDLAMSIGRFRRLLFEQFSSKKTHLEIIKFICSYLPVDNNAGNALYEYAKEQFDYAGAFSTDKSLLVEYCSDGTESRTIVHSLYGRRVNDCLSRAVAFAITRKEGKSLELGINDNGFFISGASKGVVVEALRRISPDSLAEIMRSAIEQSEVLKRRFRHCASRSLMILRNYLGNVKNVGRQQVASTILMAAVKRLDDNFPILQESRREVLEDVMDIGNSRLILQQIYNKDIRVQEIQTFVPSPFAFNIALQGFLDVLKVDDKHEFLKRMHQLVLARINGKEGKLVNPADFVKPEIKDTVRERLKNQIWSLKNVPQYAKDQLLRLIDGKIEDIDKKFFDGVEEYRKDIETTWSPELKRFLFSFLEQKQNAEFSYEHFWNEQKNEELSKLDQEAQLLWEQLSFACRNKKINPQIRYDLFKMINLSNISANNFKNKNEEENERYRDETVAWLKDFCSKPIPAIWGDKITKFLMKKLKELK